MREQTINRTGRLIRKGRRNAQSSSEMTGRMKAVWPPSRHAFICLCGGVGSGIVLFAAFLLIGSNPLITTFLCGAWIAAWVAIAIGGGFQTITGWFAFFPLFHFLLFSLPLKVLFWEEAESRLRAPFSTSLVMLLFFVGLFFAVLISRFTRIGAKPICSASQDPEFYRWLAWICYLAGTASYFVASFGQAGEDGQGGGVVGIAHFLVFFKDFSIAAYIFYGWKAGVNVWRRPTIWLFLLSGFFLGVLASAKGATSQPIVYMLVATCSIYGLRSFKLLLGFTIFGAILSSTIYPIMHYARGVEGARNGSLVERIQIMGAITQTYFTDSAARADIKEQVNEYAADRSVMYLPESAGLFDRFIMIGPTDLLVAGVDDSSHSKKFHGFELFKLGLELALPRFLYTDKPEVGSSEFLADIAGTRNATQRTNPTWGVPSQLYYSFGFPGVILGSFAVEFLFFTIINLWFGSQVRRSAWFCLLVISQNNLNSCAAIDSIPFIMIWLCLAAVAISKAASFFSNRSKRLATAL